MVIGQVCLDGYLTTASVNVFNKIEIKINVESTPVIYSLRFGHLYSKYLIEATSANRKSKKFDFEAN